VGDGVGHRMPSSWSLAMVRGEEGVLGLESWG
jgi:hypothetical protein